MKEEEAKNKWCPFARVVSIAFSDDAKGDDDRLCAGIPEAMPHNRMVISSGDDDSWDITSLRCIGSDCMAWRWDDVDQPRYGPSNTLRHGHCGLAGKL